MQSADRRGMRKTLILLLALLPGLAHAGKWTIQVIEDDMTDRRSVIAALPSERGQQLEILRTCGEKPIEIFMLRQSRPINGVLTRVRFDKTEPVKTLMIQSKSIGKNAFVFTDDIVERMRSAKTVVVEYEESAEDSVRAKFDVTGIDQTTKEMAKKCSSSRGK